MAVYPDFMTHLVEPFQIPKHWERIGGADFGIQDPTVLLMGAIDPETGIVYIYDEYFKNKLAVPQHAKSMLDMLEQVPFGRLRFLVGDPAGKRRNINDHKSIFDHYGEYGIWFKEGNNRIDAGISKVNAYFALGKLKIFTTCTNTIREGMNYKYKPMEMDSQKNADEKPIDKDNHTQDSLRYMMNELPDDPRMLINNGTKPRIFQNGEKEATTLPFALQDPEDSYLGQNRNSWLNY